MEPASRLAELLERVKAGEDAAATELVQHYEPEIRRYVRFRMTSSSVRRFVDSLDICQSVLARFFYALNSDEIEFADTRKLKAFLIQIAQNRIYDAVAWQHAKKRDARKLDPKAGEALAAIADSGSCIESLAEMQEIVSLVYAACRDDERRLIQERMNGREWSELAVEFGSTEDALRKRVQRTLERVAVETGLIRDLSVD